MHVAYAGPSEQTLLDTGLFKIDQPHCELCAGAVGLGQGGDWHLSRTDSYDSALLCIGSVDDSEMVIARTIELGSHSPLVASADEYWMSLAVAASRRSRSSRRQVGAVLVANSEVMSVGVNEVPTSGGGLAWDGDGDWLGEAHERLDRGLHLRNLLEDSLGDDEIGRIASGRIRDSYERHIRPLVDVDRAVHAEMAAVLSCARRGVPVQGSEIFTNVEPCYRCMRGCLAAGVVKITYLSPREDISDDVLRSRLRAPIQVRAFSGLEIWNLRNEVS